MRLASLFMALFLIVGCASTPSPAVEQTPSKYEKGLPATDMSSAATGDHADDLAESDTGYSRQLRLEESVVESVQSMPSSNPPEYRGPETAVGDQPLQDLPLPDLTTTYTLQLAALEDMESAIAYAARYDIEADQAGVARTHSKGQIWYILAYGVYATRADAEFAKSELQAIGVPEPWIRTLSAIEQLSKEAVDLDL